jgi:DNA-binding transcriptional regulator YhcF (GntR family)
MAVMLKVDPSDTAPIWRQIEEQMRRLVGSGAMGPGVAVPSVRELARDLRVNPATVVKAYQRLTDAGLLEVKRGEGTFVAKSPPKLKGSEIRGALKDGARRYAGVALAVGAGRAEAEVELGRAFETFEREGGGR